jgi:hypothetical protein
VEAIDPSGIGLDREVDRLLLYEVPLQLKAVISFGLSIRSKRLYTSKCQWNWWRSWRGLEDCLLLLLLALMVLSFSAAAASIFEVEERSKQQLV